MSLSERLRAAERNRLRQAGIVMADDPLLDGSTTDLDPDSGTDATVIDLTSRRGPIIDLTRHHADLWDAPLDQVTRMPCPRCGSATQLDLIDQVHQKASLSCTECFHMFRVDL